CAKARYGICHSCPGAQRAISIDSCITTCILPLTLHGETQFSTAAYDVYIAIVYNVRRAKTRKRSTAARSPCLSMQRASRFEAGVLDFSTGIYATSRAAAHNRKTVF